MQTVSIGYHREDGDFRILATLSNVDDDMQDFPGLVRSTRAALQARTEGRVIILERQDAPDYVDLEA